jgi:hypothetical protein
MMAIQPTSSRHSATPRHMIAPRMLPITSHAQSALLRSHFRKAASPHLCNVVDLERRLAFDVKVSVVLELIEFAHDNLFSSGVASVLYLERRASCCR